MYSIDALTRDCFNAILALRRSDTDTPLDAAAAYQEVRQQIDRMMGRALASGMSRQNVHATTYAIVALADEVALQSPTLAGPWRARPLQAHYFNDTDAATGFFQRIEALRSGSSREVLRVYT